MNLSLSFIRGMVAAVNPCGFVLLPTYLFYFLGISTGSSGQERAPILRALKVSGVVSAGFMVVFAVIGIVTDQLSNWLLENAKYATAVIGGVFVVLGIAMLFGYKLPIFTPNLDTGERDRTVRSMFVYGIAYAVASLGCTLPLFMTSVMMGAARTHGVMAGVANVLAYGVGMAFVVTVLTVALAMANVGMLKFLRSSMKYVGMIAGAFVLLSGAYLLWYFWWVDVKERYEPLTRGMQTLQTDVQNFLDQHWQGVAIVGAVIVLAAVAYALTHRRPPTQAPPTQTPPTQTPSTAAHQ